MNGYIFACKTSDIKDNDMKGFKFADEDVLIAKVGGQYYAVSALCPHMYGYLGKGKLNGYIIKCPVHGAEYDVRTGKIAKNVPWMIRKMSNETTDLKTYNLKVENDQVKISI
jgi:3-phenylpropionate/trans-cinnamate dioxygenase ferredoxin component